MPQIKIKAPAKLNLHLQIGGRRPDGFHNIDSLFLALAFGDTLHFETVPASGTANYLEITTDWLFPAKKTAKNDIPPEKNIISSAVSLFRQYTGFDEKLKIAVKKRIPPGGGLGGGSSNAASTLLALNSLVSTRKGCPVNDDTLAEMGAALGSDVPFFLKTASGYNAARVSGRGETVQPFSLPKKARNLSFLLVSPGFPSDTAYAYRLLDEYREKGSPLATCHSPLPIPHSLISHPPDQWPFFNDFLRVFEAFSDLEPVSGPLPFRYAGTVFKEIISGLKAAGAGFAGLSGSGSVCFGVFPSRPAALSAKKSLLKRNFYTCVSADTVLQLCIVETELIRQ